MIEGKFIIIEGTDGSGKTTQLQLLKTWLESQGSTVTVVDFPQYDQFWGKTVGRFLKGEFGDLDDVNPYLISPHYLLDQASQNSQIRQALEAGHVVLANRYVTSSMAHQTCKLATRKEQEDYLDWLQDAAYNQLNLVKEDLTIVLYVKPQISQKLSQQALERKKYTHISDIAESNYNHLKNSTEMYQYLCTQIDSWQLLDCMDGTNIDTIENVHKKVVEIVKKYK